MTNSIRKVALVALLAPAFAAASPAFAQEEAAAPLDISFSLTAVTDYRFRGVSLSNNNPAIQPQISVNHESGAYLTLWGSNVAENGGDDVELDVTAGIARDVGALTVNAAAVYYVYPGASEFNYVEFLGSVGTAIGKGNVSVNLAYAPTQDNIGDQDNVYVSVSGTHPLGDVVTLNGSFGIEDGAFGDKKKDWSVGADVDAGNDFVVGLKYVDTARTQGSPLGSGTALLSLSKAF